MKTISMEKTHLSSLTLLHLQGWIEAIGHLWDTEDWPFETMDDLAMQLEHWREDFTRINPPRVLPKEDIKVLLYGEEVVLIVKEETGEFIKLTLNTAPCTANLQTS